LDHDADEGGPRWFVLWAIDTREGQCARSVNIPARADRALKLSLVAADMVVIFDDGVWRFEVGGHGAVSRVVDKQVNGLVNYLSCALEDAWARSG